MYVDIKTTTLMRLTSDAIDYPWGIHRVMVLSLLILPWMWGAAYGPSTSVVSWFVGAGCALVAWFLGAGSIKVRPVMGWCAAILIAFLIVPGDRLDRAALGGGTALVLLSMAVARGACDRHWCSNFVFAWLIASLASAAIALVQYFDGASLFAPYIHPAAAGEALGNLRQPNQLASLLAIGLAAALWFSSQGVRLRWLLPVVMLLAVAAAATASRTGLLHWLLLSALAIWWRGPPRRRNLLLCCASLAAYAVAVLALPLLLEWKTGIEPTTLVTRVATDVGCSSRRVLWANVLELIAQRPLLGWGWGELDYAHYMHLYEGPRFCDILDNAHNLPLHVAVELGIPAALLVVGTIAVCTWRARPWAEQDPQRRLGWSVLAVLALHSMLEYPLWYAPFQIALGLALGLLAAPSRGRRNFAPSAANYVVVVLGAVLLAYAAWDYARVSQAYLAPEERSAAWADDAPAHARRSWLFSGPAGFAELTLAQVTRANAAEMDVLAERMLHYSPEPRVIERKIESATMLGQFDEAVLHLARYRAAFPDDYAKWRQAQKLPMVR